MKWHVIDYIQYTVVYANQVEGSRAWAVATGNRFTFTRHVALLLFTSSHPEFSAIQFPQFSSSIYLWLFSFGRTCIRGAKWNPVSKKKKILKSRQSDDGNTMGTPTTSIKVTLTFRIATKSHGIQRKKTRFPIYCELSTRRHNPVVNSWKNDK